MAVRLLLVSGVLLLAVSLSALGWEVLLQRPPDAEAHFRQGTRLLERGLWEEAAGSLRLALSSPREELLRGAHLNLGLAYLRSAMEGKGTEARESARRAVAQNEAALRLDPQFEAAAWNLEMALDRLESLERDREVAGAEDAQRLLSAFRLMEERRMSGELLERIRMLEDEGFLKSGGGPWW